MKCYLAVISCTVLLTACGGEGDDLDQFMANVGKDSARKIEPLPGVKTYPSVTYNKDGNLIDPFQPRVAKTNTNAGPDLNRAKEALESFPLDKLHYVGSLSKGKQVFALIKTPDNTVQQVQLGNHLGTDHGVIKKITEDSVMIAELVKDNMTGEWVNHNAELTLQE